jgi:hypothetical protein
MVRMMRPTYTLTTQRTTTPYLSASLKLKLMLMPMHGWKLLPCLRHRLHRQCTLLQW